MTEEMAQVRDDALNVLRDMRKWSMTPDRWAEVETILDGLGGVPSLADPVGRARLSSATITLERIAPRRITEVDKSAVPAPDKIRERVNQLVHELARPVPAADPAKEGKAGQ
jgi:hypothetical protein